MSTRVVRSISDFSRHRLDVDVRCYCGHRATLPHRMVVRKFVLNNWSKNLGSALGKFRCTKCGSSAAHIGPIER